MAAAVQAMGRARPRGSGAAAALLSLVLHLSVGGALSWYAASRPKPQRKAPALQVAVVAKPKPPPEPEKPKPLEPKELPPKAARKVAVVKQPLQQRPAAPPPPADTPPPPVVESKADSPAPPVLLSGITLESTSAQGSFAVATGNTLAGDPGRVGRDPKDVPAPKAYRAERYAPSAQVSELPGVLNKGEVDLRKYYPPDAKRKDFEGQVVLRLLIDADGSVAKVEVVSDPGEGLGEAAARAVREFRFSPAKVNGVAVATTIPYKITFEIN